MSEQDHIDIFGEAEASLVWTPSGDKRSVTATGRGHDYYPGLGPPWARYGGGGGISALDDIIKSRHTAGMLVDFRDIAYGFNSATDESVPLTATGDLVGRVKNQCTAVDSLGWALNEANIPDKPQWIANEGICATGGWTNERLADTTLGQGWIVLEGLSVVSAFRITDMPALTASTMEFMRHVCPGSVFNCSLRTLTDGKLYVRSFINGQTTELELTPDENGVVVVTQQTKSDGQDTATAVVEYYCNNVLIGSVVHANRLFTNYNFYLDTIRGPADPTTCKWLGFANVKGSLTSEERQAFCDHFQANAGVLA